MLQHYDTADAMLCYKKPTAQQMEGLKVVTGDLKVVDATGQPLVYFLKKGLNFPYDYQERDHKTTPGLPQVDAGKCTSHPVLMRWYDPRADASLQRPWVSKRSQPSPTSTHHQSRAPRTPDT